MIITAYNTIYAIKYNKYHTLIDFCFPLEIHPLNLSRYSKNGGYIDSIKDNLFYIYY